MSLPHSLTGTRRLVRLALRRDRVKLPAWIVIIVALIASNIPAITSFYAKSAEDRIAYALTNASSLIGRLFNGPLDGPSVGSIITNETFASSAVLVAFMSVLAVVRHTRQNEETGRLELIGSAVVARHAPLVAALLVTIGANIVLALLVAGALIGQNMPVAGSLGYAAALAAIGICFACIAATTSQIAESARGANAMAGVLIGLFFLLRAAGDALGHLTPDKMGVVSLWPSWLSPFGWAQQMHFFSTQQWWVFGLFGALFALTIGAAFYLNTQRDLGSGLLPARQGPTRAAKRLLSPFGLAWRLQKGVLKGWIIGIAVFGLTIGLVVKEFAALFAENKDLQQFLNSLGGQGSFEDVFFGSMLLYACIVIGAYVVQALQRLRSEETAGHLEPVLATHVSRHVWLASHLLCAVIGTVILLVVLGVSTGLTYAVYANASWSLIPELTLAAFVQAPAILVLAGFAVASFAILPRASIALSWASFGAVLFIGQFGDLLKLPQIIKDISPFAHTPTAPAEAVTFLPLIALAGIAATLMLLGFAWFRRRDVIGG